MFSQNMDSGITVKKTCIQILDRAQLFKTHPFKYGGGDAALQDILSFSLVWVIMRIQTEALEKEGIQS